MTQTFHIDGGHGDHMTLKLNYNESLMFFKLLINNVHMLVSGVCVSSWCSCVFVLVLHRCSCMC
jgi:hypothetical protein